MHQLEMFAYSPHRPTMRGIPPPPASLMTALTETLTNSGSLVYDATSDRHARTLAAALNAIGRRPDAPFAIRTRREGTTLHAWAEEKRETRPRRARRKTPAASPDDGRP